MHKLMMARVYMVWMRLVPMSQRMPVKLSTAQLQSVQTKVQTNLLVHTEHWQG